MDLRWRIERDRAHGADPKFAFKKIPQQGVEQQPACATNKTWWTPSFGKVKREKGKRVKEIKGKS